MKKYLLLLSLITATKVFAQVPEDAIRYSYYPQSGTARNQAIGGAMGSLGGDINATFVNPAGLGFYKTGEFVLTPSIFLNTNKATYRGTSSSTNNNSFGIGTDGIVLGFGTRYKPKSSNAVSIAITQTANFNKQIKYSGYNNYSSFGEQFAEEFANSGLTIDEALNSNSALPYTSAPALYTYLIDTATVGGQVKIKAAPETVLAAGQSLWQEMDHTAKGGITELAIGFAHNHEDKWFFGGTIGIPFYYYKSNTTFRETDTSSNVFNGFKQFEYIDDFKTVGIGINGKFGVIYRPKDYIRIGLAIHTPTFAQLTDTRTTSLTTQLETPSGQPESFAVNSNTFTNGQAGKNKYGQTTPFKAILSASYVFREVENVKKQRAFITADIEYVHHKGSRFSAVKDDEEEVSPEEKAYYKQLNSVVKELYKGAFNFRVGGELKFNTIMGRLGFAYYSNPYKDKELKANRVLLSGGVGYRNKGVFVDLTYVYAISKDVNFPYRLEDKANTFATIKEQRGNIVATVGFKF
jgi:hypothetical protein